MQENSHIRIKDIAELAGVSIGTVDRVIHDRGRVSEEVKERILKIIRELDYKPNVNARVLAGNRTVHIGILLPSYRAGEYWELPQLGIMEAVTHYNERGYNIRVKKYTYTTPEKFVRTGLKLISEGIDGIILNPGSYRESVTLVRSYFQHNIPFILIDSDINGSPSLSFVGKDPVQSGLTVAKLVHQLTRHIPGTKSVWILNVAHRLNQMYSLLTRESGFMNYFSDKKLRSDYLFTTTDIEDRGPQKEIDQKVGELLKEGVPHAVYVTGSRVHKIAVSVRKLTSDPRPLLIGHDLIRSNVQRVRDESIDFLIEEEARRQGYLAVESMVRSVVHKEDIEKKQLMNLMIFTKENLPLNSY